MAFSTPGTPKIKIKGVDRKIDPFHMMRHFSLTGKKAISKETRQNIGADISCLMLKN
jgi:hypothetical protein